MTEPKHLTLEELEAGLDGIRQSPRDTGTLQLISRRPQVDERELLQEGQLDTVEGLVGDTWITRRSSRTPDGSPHPDMQLTLVNVRAIKLIAQDRERWALAGDQLFVDLELSIENLPPGTHLAIGSAVVEVTAQPHTGCAKFQARYGADALKFVMSSVGKELRLRGMNARVARSGTVRVGDYVVKLVRGE